MSAGLATADLERLRRMPMAARWVIAARLKTLGLSITPVLAGTWFAALNGTWSIPVMLVAAAAAAAIQIGTNLWNDAADAARGTDAAERLGPPRLTSLGLLDGAAVKRSAAITFAFAACCGVYLASVGGWPIIAIGLLSLLLGYAYSMGPLPLSGTPLGEALVIAFFGVAAVMGTAHAHGAPPTSEDALLGLAFGLPAAAVLLLNNHRDRVTDARSGRRTLAILVGETWTRILYALLLLGALALMSQLAGSCGTAFIMKLAALAFALVLFAAVWRTPVSASLNRFLPLTSLFQLCLLLVYVLSAITCV